MARYTYEAERQREAFGGINWGAGFFGWLVAVGLGVLLTAILAAAGAAIAIGEVQTVEEAAEEAETLGVPGAIGLIAIALVAYFAGGYVAGRMSRFDGARNGAAVWIWSVVVAIVLAILGAIAGTEWNIFAELDLPRIPIDENATTGGIIALVLILIGTLVAAIAGGKAGEAYHRRVDAAALDRPGDDRPVAERRDADRDDDRAEAPTTRRPVRR